MELLVAISLGFLGSFHCVGMCGPIALAIPLNRSSAFTVAAGAFSYNAGRVLTYPLLGLLFGIMGQGFAIAGLQSALSVVLGILILCMLLLPGFHASFGQSFVTALIGRSKEKLRSLFRKHSMPSLMLIGLLNGFLPCGLVYMGVAGSLTSGTAVGGMLFMAAFGLGTVPAMFAISVFRERIGIRLREKIRKAMPVFSACMAVLMILRGLNLGIPYISPAVEVVDGSVHHKCCHK